MNTLHQIYCTHCTPDSSAYRLSTNGYAVRGGSLPGAELRRFYEAIERFMGYHLPSDTPSELKTQLTATTAPRKMVFSPEVGELQMVCQVCYRQEDTIGRPGSYFAHALVSPNRSAQDTLTTRECLKLWGLPQWQIQDPLGDDLGTLESFELLDQWAVDQPVICDELLRQFLTVEDGGTITAGSEIVPDRLRRQPPAERQKLLRDCLLRYLEANGKKESLLLVAEPGLAALLFYGIARLLPPGPFSDRISFSTYEYDPTRLKTRLAATRYHEPEHNDVPPDMYHPDRCRGAALNTWLSKRRTKTQQPADYAKRVIDLLVDGNWGEVDEFHKDLVHAGVDDSAGLDGMARLDQQLATSFDPALDDQGRFPNAVKKRFCQRRVHRRLGDETVLKRVLELNTKEAVRVFRGLLYLLAVDSSLADDDPVLVRMLKTKVHEKEVGRFIDREEIPRQRRITVVEQFVTEHHKLPRGGAAAEYLPELIPLLSDETLEQFRDNLSDEKKPEFVLKLAEALLNSRERRGILPGMVESLSNPQLLDVLCDKRAGHLLRLLPKAPWPVLQSRLQDILQVLPDDPVRFSKRLRALDLAKKHLSPEARNTIVAWRKFEEIVGKLVDTSNGVHDRPLLKAIDSAVPAQDGEFDPERRVRQLVMITPLVEEQLESHPELDGIVAEFHLKMIIPIIDEMTVPEFCNFAEDSPHQDVLNRLPAKEPVLSSLLTRVLDGIHDHPREFLERYAVLRVFKGRVAGATDRLEAWLKVGESMKHIDIFKSELATGELASSVKKCTGAQGKTGLALGKELGKALLQAMPRQFPPTANWGADERDRVGVQIAETYLGTSSYDDSFIRESVQIELKRNDNQSPLVRAMLPLARPKPAASPARAMPPSATMPKPAGSRNKSAVSMFTILRVTAAVSVIAGIIMLLMYFGPLINGVNSPEIPGAESDEPVAEKSTDGEPKVQKQNSNESETPPPNKNDPQKNKTPPMLVAENQPENSTPPKSDVKKTQPPSKEPVKGTAGGKKKPTPPKAAAQNQRPVIATVTLPGLGSNNNQPYRITRRDDTSADVKFSYDSIKTIAICRAAHNGGVRAKYDDEGSAKIVLLTKGEGDDTQLAKLSFSKPTMPSKETPRLNILIFSNDLTKDPSNQVAIRSDLYYTPLKIVINMGPTIYLILQPAAKYSNLFINCPYKFCLEISKKDPVKKIYIPRPVVKQFKDREPGHLEFTFSGLVDGDGKLVSSEPIAEAGGRWRVAEFGTLAFERGELGGKAGKAYLSFKRATQYSAKEVREKLKMLRDKLNNLFKNQGDNLAFYGLLLLVVDKPPDRLLFKERLKVCWEHRERILSEGYRVEKKPRIKKKRALELLNMELKAPRTQKGDTVDRQQRPEFDLAIQMLIKSIHHYRKKLGEDPRAFPVKKKMFVRATVNYVIRLNNDFPLKLPVIEYDKK